MQLRGRESLVEDLHSTGQGDQFKGGLEEVMDEGVNGRVWNIQAMDMLLVGSLSFSIKSPQGDLQTRSLIPD